MCEPKYISGRESHSFYRMGSIAFLMKGSKETLISSLINQVSREQLYNHVRVIEGARHPLNDLAHLQKVETYIHQFFVKLGLIVRVHTFTIPPFSHPFLNIEAIYIPEKIFQSKLKQKKVSGHPSISHTNLPSPYYIICAHYDTVFDCPGAVDNAASIAIMLECSRIISETKYPEEIHFLAFTAEEFNPAWVLARNQKMKELGLMDEQNHYTSLQTSQIMDSYKRKVWSYRQHGVSPSQAIKNTTKDLEPTLTSELSAFFAFECKLYEPFDHVSIWGNFALFGSEKWVVEHPEEWNLIKGVINLDALGFNSSSISPHSQLQQFEFENSEKINFDDKLEIQSEEKSDVKREILKRRYPIQMTANSPCKALMDLFPKYAQQYNICSLEFVLIHLPFEFDYLARNQPDLLRSDHTSFWKRGIPAVFLTDLSDFPNPFYHTPADTLNRVDFEMLHDLTQVLLLVLWNIYPIS